MNKYSAISIHPLASSVQRERILLSYQGQYYEANQSIVELVKELQFHETEEEAIAAYTTADYRQVHYAPLYAQATEAVFPLREGTVQRGGG